MKHPDEKIMREAINLARKKHAVGCVLVKDGKIVSRGWTTVYKDKLPFAHGEINAIRKASKKLGTYNLSGCWLYTTFEPCPMCAAASVWARLEGIVYGASMDDRNRIYTQRILLPCRTLLKRGTPKVKLHEEFLRQECKKLLLLKFKR